MYVPSSFNSFRFIVSFNLHNNYSYFTEEETKAQAL